MDRIVVLLCSILFDVSHSDCFAKRLAEHFRNIPRGTKRDHAAVHCFSRRVKADTCLPHKLSFIPSELT
jgi:hypothetical protein